MQTHNPGINNISFFSPKGNKAVFLLKSIITIHQDYLLFFIGSYGGGLWIEARLKKALCTHHSFIHSYCCVQGTALGTEDSSVNVKDKSPLPLGAVILVASHYVTTKWWLKKDTLSLSYLSLKKLKLWCITTWPNLFWPLYLKRANLSLCVLNEEAWRV